MGELAALLSSIAAVISAVGGALIGVLALTRGSPRERQQAAKNALDRLSGQEDSDDTDDQQWAAIEDLRRKLGGSDS